jgi:hypothetical protein
MTVHVRFVVDKVALERVLIPVLRFSPVSITPLMLIFTHASSGGWTMGPLETQFTVVWSHPVVTITIISACPDWGLSFVSSASSLQSVMACSRWDIHSHRVLWCTSSVQRHSITRPCASKTRSVSLYLPPCQRWQQLVWFVGLFNDADSDSD